MRTALLTCFAALLLGACAAEPSNGPPPDTLLFEGREELIDLYHALPGATGAGNNPKLVEALNAAHAEEFKKAAERAEGGKESKDSFEQRTAMRLMAVDFVQHPTTNVAAKYIAVSADVTVPPFDFRDGKVHVCWERSCNRDRPELVQRLVNYVLRVSVPDSRGFDISPDEALARTLQERAAASPDRTLRALYVAKIEGADPADNWGGVPIFQVRARLIKLLIAPANPPERDMVLADIAASPALYTASF